MLPGEYRLTRSGNGKESATRTTRRGEVWVQDMSETVYCEIMVKVREDQNPSVASHGPRPVTRAT